MAEVAARELKVGDRIQTQNSFGVPVEGVVTNVTVTVTIDMQQAAMLDADDKLVVLESGLPIPSLPVMPPFTQSPFPPSANQIAPPPQDEVVVVTAEPGKPPGVESDN